MLKKRSNDRNLNFSNRGDGVFVFGLSGEQQSGELSSPRLNIYSFNFLTRKFNFHQDCMCKSTKPYISSYMYTFIITSFMQPRQQSHK